MDSRLATTGRLATIVTLAALFLIAGPASRAGAEFTGIVRLTPTTATDSSTTKSLTATCPAGTRVITAGGDTTGSANGRVVLDVMRPDPTLTKVTVHAREDETGTSATWFLQAFVTCAPAPAGLELVKATSPTDSAAKSVTATCPTGKRLLGSGAETTGAGGQVLVGGLRPNSGLTSATVSATEDATGTTATWSVTAYAICAPAPRGLQLVGATSASDSTASKVATAHCPAGLSVIGTLGTVNSSAGHVVRDAVFSDADLTSAGFSAFEDVAGTAKSWSVTAYAICAGSAKLVTQVSSRGTWLSVTTGNACPAGMYALGVGADISGGFGRVSLEGMDPGSSFDARGATHDGAVDSWALTAQGVCSSPFKNTLISSTTSLSDSSQQKIVTASCDPGQRLLGVSGMVRGDNVVLSSARPDDASLTSATAIAIEDEAGTDAAWSLTLHIVCSEPPPGLQLVTADTPLQSDDFQQITATCPAGKHVIGTGHRTLYDSAELMLHGLSVDPALSKVTMTVFEDHDGADAPWLASVYAICIDR
jgi:hypothetical protein